MTAPTPAPIDDLLRERFGFATFRPGQREVITAVLERSAALAVFPTGSGKSLCYQLPALALEGVTVVVSPLIALMKDQVDFLKRRGIEAARLDSSLGEEGWRDVTARLQQGQLKLLYVAPERFNNERFLEVLGKVRVGLFAVDEAHCISEWGHNFRPDYLKLARMARAFGVERVLALTATATPAVVESICQGFGIPRDCAIVTGFYRPNLTLLTTPVTAAERDAVLLERLRSRPLGSSIVYVTLQKTAERVAKVLAQAGFDARAYHAGLEAEERAAIQDAWMASDKSIVVATIAFGMGIDKADVRYVYHYNLPKSLENYSQEVGRAGRDGAPSTVELLACADDVPVLENFAYGDTPTPRALQGLLAELFSREREFDLNPTELANRHDLRTLVLETALTYLELQGVLQQGTPFYASYEVKPLLPVVEICQQLKGEPATFLGNLFAAAKKGRVWYGFDPVVLSERLGADRQRVVRALEYLQQKGWAELRAADIRKRYTRLRPAGDEEALAAELGSRFQRREEQEMSRLKQVMELVTHEGCQVNKLTGYFGERREAPCGHCTSCQGSRRRLPPARELPPLPAGLDVAALRALREVHPGALGEPRQVARFLCGLTSPALTRAKVGRHALFGALEERRFSDVLEWCRGLAG